MADDIDITPGSGKTIRTDEVNGKHVQVIKSVTTEVTNMTYTNSLLTGYTEDGVTWVIARNGSGDITSITAT